MVLLANREFNRSRLENGRPGIVLVVVPRLGATISRIRLTFAADLQQCASMRSRWEREQKVEPLWAEPPPRCDATA
jgi:hypothetical protein